MACVTLWIGETLGPVERACLRSVMRQGHQLVLYCYLPPKAVPEGVEIRDAEEILPQSEIFYHHRGSVALFADWFRYELQRHGAGIWVDTDVYLLQPLDESREYLFGEQSPGLINNAVLRLPAHSAMLDDLVEPFSGRTPRWLPKPAYWLSKMRERVTGAAHVGSMPWGTTGPSALTAAASKEGLLSHALPPSVFYPAPWEKAAWITDPAQSLDEWVTDATVALHLWNERIKGFKNAPPPKGSFLERLHREGGA
jgi:hypothetical protein